MKTTRHRKTKSPKSRTKHEKLRRSKPLELLDLPPEVLTAIFAHVDPPSLVHLSLVSRRANDIANEEYPWKVCFMQRWGKGDTAGCPRTLESIIKMRSGVETEEVISSPKEEGRYSWKQRYALFSQLNTLFNHDPKECIDSMLLDGLLAQEAEQEREGESIAFPMPVSRFLRSGGLSAQKVRWFLKFYGFLTDEESPYGKLLAIEFLKTLHFQDMDLLEALRSLLETIAFPSSSQMIDKLMEGFAAKYCEDNNIGHHVDGFYVCSFALIMVNTDLHNPLVKVKLTKERFVNDIVAALASSSTGIVPKIIQLSQIEGWYDALLARELTCKDVMKQGKLKLKKPGPMLKRTKKRWVVLTTDKLQIYEDSSMKKPVLAVWLSYRMVAKSTSLPHEHAFQIVGDEAVATLFFCSRSAEEVDEWRDAINTVIREWKRREKRH